MFLNATEIRKHDPAMIKLHEIFIRAYPDKVGALAIAGQVGILQADISVHPKMRYTWWSILEEAARERQLRRLVETALRDPTIGGWHDAMGACVASANDRVSAPKVEMPAEETPHERGRHPIVGDVAPLWKPGQTLRIRYPVRKMFDPNSIMILPIPETYLRGGTPIGWSAELSPLDKQFIAALYPYRTS